MLRMIARWFISRSIDEDRRPPGWLRHWIDRDDELQQFEMLSRQLGSRLKDDAAGWISSQALAAAEESAARRRIVTPQPASFRRERMLALSLAVCTLAACALFAVARWQPQPDQAGQPTLEGDHRITQAPAPVTIAATDREWLATAWKSSRANLGQLRAHARGLPRRAEVLKLPDVSAIVEPAEVAGSAAGRALATLDRGMESEQQQLISDMKTAFSFFAYRLPASLATLVGQ